MTPVARAVLDAYRQHKKGNPVQARATLDAANVKEPWRPEYAADFWDWLFDNTDMEKETCKDEAAGFLNADTAFTEEMERWFEAYVDKDVPVHGKRKPKPLKMKMLRVPVQFDGFVTVMVPKRLNKKDATILAKKLARSRIVASTDNPDAPDEDAFDEYTEECSAKVDQNAEADWDASKVHSVGGAWTTEGDVQALLT